MYRFLHLSLHPRVTVDVHFEAMLSHQGPGCPREAFAQVGQRHFGSARGRVESFRIDHRGEAK